MSTRAIDDVRLSRLADPLDVPTPSNTTATVQPLAPAFEPVPLLALDELAIDRRPLDPSRRHVAYRSVASPGYRRRIRRSSSAVSPLPSSRRERSSAPSTKARRSFRFSSLWRDALVVGWRGCSSTATFSPFDVLETTELGRPSAEPNRDPTSAEVRDEVPRALLLEAPSEVGHVGRQGCHVDGPLGTPVARRELGRDHRRQGRGIAQRRPDCVVSGIGRRRVSHRTDVLIAGNPRRTPFA